MEEERRKAMTETDDMRGRGEAAAAVKLDPNSPEFIRDPYPTYRELRDRCPVAHSDQFGGFWMLSRYRDVREAARDPQLFSSSQGVTLPPVGNPMPFLPIELDPPEHSKYRKTMQTWFSVRAIEKLEPTVREIVSGLIDDIEPDGRADLTEALAGPLPPIVIALLLGLPREDWPRFRELAETMVTAAEVEDQERGAVAGMELLAYLGAEIEARREAPKDDMLTKMIGIEIDGEPIPSDAVLGLAFFLLMAGHETTVGGLSMMLMHVAKNPEVKQRLIDEPALIEKAVEEVLRLEPPIQTIARTVSHDVCVHGVDLAEGQKVVLAWGSANRDPSIFDHPDEFVVDRPRNPHIAFGDGIHRCLGAALARLEMRITLEEVLRRIPGYRINDDAGIEVGGFLARHVKRLPVEW
jgi:cytochrome P450